MTVALVDTTILVDLLRQHAPAFVWFSGQPRLGVVAIAELELIQGAQNKTAQLQSLKLLSRFDIEYPTQTDMIWAKQQLLNYRLSHNIGFTDCLIASVSYRLGVPIYTHNLKHIVPLLGIGLAIRPY